MAISRENIQQHLSQSGSEAELADFFDNAVVALHWVGPDGTIIRANRAELDLLGYTAEEYIGHNISEFHEDQGVIGDILTRLRDDETLYNYPARLLCKDGSVKHVLLCSNVYRENGQFKHTRCFTRDMTELKQVEESLKLSHTRYRSLYEWEKKTREVLQEIRKSIDTEKIFPVAIEKVAKVLGVNRAFIIEFAGNQVTPVRYEYRSHEDVKPFTGMCPPWEFCPYLAVTARNEMIWSGDCFNDNSVPQNDEWVKFSHHFDIRSIVAAPIVYNGKLMNVIVFHTLEPYHWTESELFFIKVVADQLSTLFYQEKVREELIQTARLKSDFLSKMSHELRTPLNAIIGYGKMVEKGMAGPLTDKQGEYLRNVGVSAEHLLGLVNDLLDFSKLEAGKMSIVKELVNVQPIVDEARMMVETIAEKKRVNLSFQVQPDICKILVDPARLRQILINLITNAIKFNHAGGTVSVRVNQSGKTLVCEVQDTGIGIAKDKIPELFNRFHQLDNTAGRYHEGTGLGLVLVKELLELHGGSIAVDSVEGSGSTFTIKLPCGV